VNKWLIVGLIVLVVLIVVGVAYDQGAFDNLAPSTLAMILAAVAAPYMAVKNMLFGNKELKQFQDKYQQLKSEELVHRTGLDLKIKAKEQRIAELDKELQLLDAKLEVLELKKNNVEQTVNAMSVDDTKKEAQNLFGN
jgi:hypothetical protein